MESIDLIRNNLRKSRDIVLAKIEDMANDSLVFPTPNGGGHTIWVLGHLAYIEGLVVRHFMMGEPNPLADWGSVFDGADTSADPDVYPAFEVVLANCRRMREETLGIVDRLAETDLDHESAAAPDGTTDMFGTWRDCLQFVSDHWYMHRGQLADARRAARRTRMWY